MRRLRLIFPTLLVVTLMAAQTASKESAAAQPAAALNSIKPRTLCSATERVVWSCETTKDGRIASLCGSKDLDADRGYVQYRFGLPGRVELEYPGTRTNTQAAFKFSRYTRPLVTYLKLVFVNNGFTYTLSDDSNDEEKPPAREASVSVAPAGANGKESTLRCRRPITGSLMKLEGVVQKEEYTE
jgi:hypothetical protein